MSDPRRAERNAGSISNSNAPAASPAVTAFKKEKRVALSEAALGEIFLSPISKSGDSNSQSPEICFPVISTRSDESETNIALVTAIRASGGSAVGAGASVIEAGGA